MLEEVTPAVVNISVTKSRRPSNTRFFFNGREYNWNMRDLPDQLRRFMPPPQLDRRGAAGVIVDAQRGFVITNHHVIDGADEISVHLNDNRTVEAELLGSDRGTDIALLRIEADNLTDIDFADMETVRVGDYVVAIGNPFGVGQTVTSGIVSALGRRASRRGDGFENYIQTDASINVGNSGGALVDLEGNLIGINTVIISGNGGGSNGVGFAVPADMVASVMGHLERDGEVRRGMLGVSIVTLTPDVAAALQMDERPGALITGVEPGSAAEQAGLQVGDVVVEMNDEDVDSSNTLRNMVGLARQGDEVELALYRDGRRLTVDAEIGGFDGRTNGRARGRAQGDASSPINQLRGAALRTITKSDNLASDEGVLVTQAPPRSLAYRNGLRQGDVIIAAGRQTITDVESLNQAMESAGRNIALRVIRGGREMLLFIS